MLITNQLSNSHKNEMYQRLGTTALIQRSVTNYHGERFSWLDQWLASANVFDQLAVFYNQIELPVGFVCWGYFCDDVLARMQQAADVPLHKSEWTEGRIPWVIDFVAPQAAKVTITHCAQTLFKHEREIGVIRRHQDGTVKRIYKLNNPYFEV